MGALRIWKLLGGAGTQCKKAGLYLSDTSDVVLEAQPYFSSADMGALKLEKAVLPQGSICTELPSHYLKRPRTP